MKNGLNILWENPVPFFHKLRLIKSYAEIALMQKTCDIASEAIIETIKKSQPRNICKYWRFLLILYNNNFSN